VKLAKDVREFIALFNSHGVEFIVVGGHAVAFHGYPRYTGDVDLLVRPSPDNAQRILAALEAFGFGGLGITANDLECAGKVVQLGVAPNRIDLVTAITGVDFDTAWGSRESALLDDIQVNIIGRDALLANKRATDRAKDRADVAVLEGDAAKDGDES
jgi:hypothetical protein